MACAFTIVDCSVQRSLGLRTSASRGWQRFLGAAFEGPSEEAAGGQQAHVVVLRWHWEQKMQVTTPRCLH